MNPYRWGILGPGRIAKKFAEGLKSLPNAELYAIGSRSEDRAKAFAEEHRAKRSYGSYEALAADPDVDVIYIASPHSEHAKHTILCLNNNKPVLCEKAFALNTRQVKSMTELAKTRKMFLMEALWTRFLPHIIQLKEIVNSGIIGEIRLAEANFGFQGNTDPSWRLVNPNLGGGALLDVGIYPLFLMKYLFGQPDNVNAYANITAQNIDTSLTAIMNYKKKGILAAIHSSIEVETKTDCTLYGSRGKIHVQRRFFTPTDIVIFHSDGKEEKISVPYTGNGYNYEATEVMRCLDNGLLESPLMPWKFSEELMELMDEIRQQSGIRYPADKIP